MAVALLTASRVFVAVAARSLAAVSVVGHITETDRSCGEHYSGNVGSLSLRPVCREVWSANESDAFDHSYGLPG